MSETNNNHSSNHEKETKIRRKPKTASVLTPTFTVGQEVNTRHSNVAASGSTLLHRSSASSSSPGTSEIANSQTSSQQTHGFTFGAVPAHTGLGHTIQANMIVNAPGDRYEQEADRVARQVMSMKEDTSPFTNSLDGVLNAPASPAPSISRIDANDGSASFEAPQHVQDSISRMKGGGIPLPESERNFFEGRMGYDFSQVRLHTDSSAIQASRDIQAHAFTVGNDIVFNEGTYQPGTYAGRRLLAHELTHVVQQTGDTRKTAIQRKIDPTYTLKQGEFKVAATTGPSLPNLPITIEFHPARTANYSNQIGLIQIVKLTDSAGANIEPQSLQASRGADLRTKTTDRPGAESGFFTDVTHRNPFTGGAAVDTPRGSDMAPQYQFGTGPAQPGTAPAGLSRPNSGTNRGAIVGYKRSDDPADIKAAQLTDRPGYATVNPANTDLNFKFETVAKGEDSMNIYGALKWSFEIRSGVVQNETASADDSQSATFDSALSRHRDFYVHEPVIFYFDFDSRTLSSTETDKIDEFTDYLRRFSDVKVKPEGFADSRGGVSQYNQDLSRDRALAVDTALRGKGIAATQIEPIAFGNATQSFTPDATTNQDDDANRRGNRRVVLTFRHVPTSGGSGSGTGGSGTP